MNWKVRFKQKAFLVALFSALLLAVQAVASLFGYEITEEFGTEITGVFNTLLTVLTILGVVVDPTTKGVTDSKAALRYDEPKDDNHFV